METQELIQIIERHYANVDSSDLKIKFDAFIKELTIINYDRILFQAFLISVNKNPKIINQYAPLVNLFIRNSFDMLTIRIYKLLEKSNDHLSLKSLFQIIRKKYPLISSEVRKDLSLIEVLIKESNFKNIADRRNNNVAHTTKDIGKIVKNVALKDFEIIFTINKLFAKYNVALFNKNNGIVPHLAYGAEGVLKGLTFPWLNEGDINDTSKELLAFIAGQFNKEGLFKKYFDDVK